MRRVTKTFAFLVVLAVSMALNVAVTPASAQGRIGNDFGAAGRAPVRGSVHPLARPEFDEGSVDASMMLYRMVMSFRPTAAQQAELDALLEEQQNPVSPFYHQWLTPEQLADRFGMSAGDISRVVAWLQQQGFTIVEVARNRTYVAFSGSVAQVQAAFGTPIHRYLVRGEQHYANVYDPALPAPLAQVIASISGLHDFLPKPRGGIRAHPQFTSNISGNHFLAPDDFATIYDLTPLYAKGIDGTGQKLAVMGQTALATSTSGSTTTYPDIDTFRSLSGLPPIKLSTVLVPGSPTLGVVTSDIGEANLDVQWSGAVARNATIIYVYEAAPPTSGGAFGAMQYAVSQNLAPVISISYGDCEPHFSSAEITTLTNMGKTANAQGQTIVGPSGDSGAADCDYPTGTKQVTSATNGLAVDVPASLPYVTGAGGTTFNEGSNFYWTTNNTANNASAISYIPETSWNDTTFEIANGGSLAATGGGVSTLFAKPTWQTGAGVPADGQRDVPDISFAASADHDGYLVCSQGSCTNGYRNSSGNLTVFGGTSASAPVFAGIVTLVNQQMAAAQGNVNPRLYQLAGSSSDIFHDITTGDNKVPCTAGTPDCPTGTTSIGYSAGAGYDLVTGLGTADVYNLLSEWPTTGASPASFTITTTAGSTSPGSVQYSASVAPVNGFSGTVNFAVTGLPTGLTATVTPSSVVLAGAAPQSATVQVLVANSVTPCALNNNNIITPCTYVGAVGASSGIIARGASVPLAPDFQLSPSPASLSVNVGTSVTSTINLSSLVGFNGPVTLSCSVSGSLGSCSLSSTSVSAPGSVTLTVTGSTAGPAGSVTVQGTSGLMTHTAAIALTVNPAPDFGIAANPTSLSLTAGTSGNVGTSTITVSALNGFSATVALTCSVSSTLPGTTCAVSPSSVTSSGTATVTVTAPTTHALLQRQRSLFFPFSGGLFAIAIGMVVAGSGEHSSRRKKLRIVLLGLIVIALAMMPACGGGGGSSTSSSGSSTTTTTTQTGTVTVAGTSGSLSHTASLTVTVH